MAQTSLRDDTGNEGRVAHQDTLQMDEKHIERELLKVDHRGGKCYRAMNCSLYLHVNTQSE